MTTPLLSRQAPSTFAPTRRGVHARLSGLPVFLRPLGADEAGTVQSILDGLSPQSRYERFLAPMPRVPAAVVAALSAVDGMRHVCWVAEVHGRPIGTARYVLVDPETAEIAVEVVDDHHGVGVGAALVDAVTTVAAARGVKRLQATWLAENTRSAALMAALGLGTGAGASVREAAGSFHLLRRPRVDRRGVLDVALGCS